VPSPDPGGLCQGLLTVPPALAPSRHRPVYPTRARRPICRAMMKHADTPSQHKEGTLSPSLASPRQFCGGGVDNHRSACARARPITPPRLVVWGGASLEPRSKPRVVLLMHPHSRVTTKAVPREPVSIEQTVQVDDGGRRPQVTGCLPLTSPPQLGDVRSRQAQASRAYESAELGLDGDVEPLSLFAQCLL
jgi:hypothetical protein